MNCSEKKKENNEELNPKNLGKTDKHRDGSITRSVYMSTIDVKILNFI